MSATIEEQLRDYFADVDAYQVPVDVAIIEPPEIELDRVVPVAPLARRRSPWLLITAAAAVLIIAALVGLGLFTDDDSRTITDTPTTTSTSTTTAPTSTTIAPTSTTTTVVIASAESEPTRLLVLKLQSVEQSTNGDLILAVSVGNRGILGNYVPWAFIYVTPDGREVVLDVELTTLVDYETKNFRVVVPGGRRGGELVFAASTERNSPLYSDPLEVVRLEIP